MKFYGIQLFHILTEERLLWLERDSRNANFILRRKPNQAWISKLDFEFNFVTSGRDTLNDQTQLSLTESESWIADYWRESPSVKWISQGEEEKKKKKSKKITSCSERYRTRTVSPPKRSSCPNDPEKEASRRKIPPWREATRRPKLPETSIERAAEALARPGRSLPARYRRISRDLRPWLQLLVVGSSLYLPRDSLARGRGRARSRKRAFCFLFLFFETGRFFPLGSSEKETPDDPLCRWVSRLFYSPSLRSSRWLLCYTVDFSDTTRYDTTYCGWHAVLVDGVALCRLP